jgi:hypothetical protein
VAEAQDVLFGIPFKRIDEALEPAQFLDLFLGQAVALRPGSGYFG